MKIVGYIKPEINDKSELTNEPYANGTIIMLSRTEASLLGLLQQSWDGSVFKFPPERHEIEERDMSDAFKAIRSFVEAKFALNVFREKINDLDSLLIKGDGNDP